MNFLLAALALFVAIERFGSHSLYEVRVHAAALQAESHELRDDASPDSAEGCISRLKETLNGCAESS